MALVQACLQHLSEQQMKILRAMVARQSYTLNRWNGTTCKNVFMACETLPDVNKKQISANKKIYKTVVFYVSISTYPVSKSIFMSY